MNTSIEQLKAIFGIPNWFQLTPSEIETTSTYLQVSECDFHRALWEIKLECAACYMEDMFVTFLDACQFV